MQKLRIVNSIIFLLFLLIIIISTNFVRGGYVRIVSRDLQFVVTCFF